MTINELKKIIEYNGIDLISFLPYLDNEKTVWEVFINGSRLVSSSGEFLHNSSRDCAHKTFTSLDRAHSAIKKLGYEGKIDIDG